MHLNSPSNKENTVFKTMNNANATSRQWQQLKQLPQYITQQTVNCMTKRENYVNNTTC